MGTEKIKSKQEFVVFLRELHADYLQNGKDWENTSLERFLEAMIAYTEDIQGYYENTNQNIDANKPSWKVFADILEGASIYE